MDEESIEARIQILDQLAQKGLNVSDEGVNTALLSREGLTDVLVALYEECCKLKFSSSKHITAFTKKCKYNTLW